MEEEVRYKLLIKIDQNYTDAHAYMYVHIFIYIGIVADTCWKTFLTQKKSNISFVYFHLIHTNCKFYRYFLCETVPFFERKAFNILLIKSANV